MQYSQTSYRRYFFHNAVAFICLGLLSLMAGCDKLPEFGGADSDKDKTAENSTDTANKQPGSDSTDSNSSQTASNPPVDPGASGSTSPGDLAAFLETPPFKRTNSQLKSLASSGESAEKLTKLDLSGSQVKSDGLKVLPQFKNIVELNLGDVKGLQDSDLLFVGQLPNLEVLVLQSTPITDNGLSHLTSLKKLKSLNLQRTGISDSGFLHLKNLTALEELNVANTGTNGSGFKVFYPRGLRVIDASHTAFGTDGFNHIANSKTLESLSVAQASVVDNNLRALKGCINLRKLDLAYNSVTTLGFKDLGGLRNLEHLDLWNNSGVGDVALNVIKNYKKLKFLNTEGTGVSGAALARLKKDYIPELNSRQN
ncbi:MAG: leucine-rich repeat domain-containing protein [Planctomycetaceae bacterium]|nr:leucine-rich repeat domain-containing protein [Planctomycetaceae bacterium]